MARQRLQGNVEAETLTLSEAGVLHGEGGNDILTGTSGHDELYGGEGDDRLSGGYGNDILNGGSGDDYLEGGYGNDIYVFGRGYGQDTVVANDNTSGKNDVLRLLGLSLEDLEFQAVYSEILSGFICHDLVIRIKDTGETVTVKNGLASINGAMNLNIDQRSNLEFGDGSTLSYAALVHSGLLVMPGTAGEDTLSAPQAGATLFGLAEDDTLACGNGHDTLDGGAGNDTLTGGAGNDIYIFRPGDGQDSLNNAGEGVGSISGQGRAGGAPGFSSDRSGSSDRR